MNNLMTIDEMKNHEWVVSWSGGKDSTATIILCHENNIPIKKIVYVRMMWDETLPATLPIMTEFVDNTIDIFNKWGYEVECVKSIRTAKSLSESVYYKSKHPEKNGYPYGIAAFGRGNRCWFTSIKMRTVKSCTDNNDYNLIGYSCDEKIRIRRLGGKKQSILVALNKTGGDCIHICKKYDLLSPLYELGLERDGCFFCPYASKQQIAYVKGTRPDLVKIIYNMIENSYVFSEDVGKNISNWYPQYVKDNLPIKQLKLLDLTK